MTYQHVFFLSLQLSPQHLMFQHLLQLQQQQLLQIQRPVLSSSVLPPGQSSSQWLAFPPTDPITHLCLDLCQSASALQKYRESWESWRVKSTRRRLHTLQLTVCPHMTPGDTAVTSRRPLPRGQTGKICRLQTRRLIPVFRAWGKVWQNSSTPNSF